MTFLLDTMVVSFFLQAGREHEIWMPGEHILGMAVFLRRLFEQRVLEDAVVLDEVISLAVDAAQRPTWWASWRAGLSA